MVREESLDPRVRARIAAIYLMEELTPESAFPSSGIFPACSQRDQARCVVAWYSVISGRSDPARLIAHTLVWASDGTFKHLGQSPVICVNPLTGSNSSEMSSAETNRGGANASGLAWGRKPSLLPHQVEARCENGLLRVSTPESYQLRLDGNWASRQRAPSFNLFYGDIEADARTRLSVWYGGPLASPITQHVDVKSATIHRIGNR